MEVSHCGLIFLAALKAKCYEDHSMCGDKTPLPAPSSRQACHRSKGNLRSYVVTLMQSHVEHLALRSLLPPSLTPLVGPGLCEFADKWLMV